MSDYSKLQKAMISASRKNTIYDHEKLDDSARRFADTAFNGANTVQLSDSALVAIITRCGFAPNSNGDAHAMLADLTAGKISYTKKPFFGRARTYEITARQSGNEYLLTRTLAATTSEPPADPNRHSSVRYQG